MILIEWILDALVWFFEEIIIEGFIYVFYRLPRKGFRYFKSRFHKRDAYKLRNLNFTICELKIK